MGSSTSDIALSSEIMNTTATNDFTLIQSIKEAIQADLVSINEQLAAPGAATERHGCSWLLRSQRFLLAAAPLVDHLQTCARLQPAGLLLDRLDAVEAAVKACAADGPGLAASQLMRAYLCALPDYQHDQHDRNGQQSELCQEKHALWILQATRLRKLADDARAAPRQRASATPTAVS